MVMVEGQTVYQGYAWEIDHIERSLLLCEEYELFTPA